MTEALSSGSREGGSLSPVRIGVSVLLIAGFLASFVSVLTPASAQTSNGVASFVPDTALFYGELELDQSSDQYVLSSELLERAKLDALLTDEELTDLQTGAQGIGAFVDGEAGFFLSELPIDEDFTLDDLASDVSDVSMDPDETVGGDVPDGWAVVLRPSDVDVAFNFYSEAVFGEDPSDPVESEYGGYTILTQEGTDEFTTGASMAMVDDVIVIATVPEDIEPVIDTVNGELDPLSADESYTEVRDALESEVLASGYINGPSLLDAFNDQDSATLASLPQDVLASFAAYSGFVFWADEPGFRLDTVAIPAEGADLPEASAFEPAFTTNLPASSLFYFGGQDLGEDPSLNALALLAAQSIVGVDPLAAAATPVADPEAYAEQIFADAEGVVGFNIKTDVLDQLVGEWALAGTVANVTDPSPTIDGIFVTQVNDGETVQGVVETITNLIASQPEEGVALSSRQVNGFDVTVVDMTEGGTPIILEFGVVDDQLLIGVNEGIDSFTGEVAEPLADDAVFQSTLAELPADYSSVSYVNVQGLLPLIEEAIAASTTTSTLDNDPACGEFASQEEAQTAYDSDDLTNFSLDLDFDGEACEDYFSQAATPEAASSGIGNVNVLSVGSVTFSDGESSGTSTIIHIGE